MTPFLRHSHHSHLKSDCTLYYRVLITALLGRCFILFSVSNNEPSYLTMICESGPHIFRKTSTRMSQTLPHRPSGLACALRFFSALMFTLPLHKINDPRVTVLVNDIDQIPSSTNTARDSTAEDSRVNYSLVKRSLEAIVSQA